ncbi:MAG: hypothetical protein IJ310_03145 [Clostridia bacterium]|nr:hypothetical protein [Clostridia bacterium]
MGFFGKMLAVGVVATSAKKIAEKVSRKKDRQESNDYIKVSNFYDLVGLNYREVRETIEGYGFERVSCVARRDLKRHLKQGLFFKERNDFENGEVEEISINGETDFDKYDKFLPTARVVIIYHTYQDDEVEEKPAKKEKLFAKCSNCKARFEYTTNKPICPYCGEPVKK